MHQPEIVIHSFIHSFYKGRQLGGNKHSTFFLWAPVKSAILAADNAQSTWGPQL